MDHDLEKDFSFETYAADKGGDDGTNHDHLALLQLHSAVRLRKVSTNKKDKNKLVWLALERTREYRQGLKKRCKLEVICCLKHADPR